MVHQEADLNAAIGNRIRAARTERGWTLDRLAERSGVSRRMLVSIEHGEANPSLTTLLRISEAVGVGLPALVEPSRPSALRIRRADQQAVLWHGDAGGQGVLVAATQPPQVVELWRWTLATGDTRASEPHTPGTQELLLVEEGRLRLTVGEESAVLEAGESASFAGDLPHAYTAVDGPVRFVMTVTEPRGGR